MSSFNCELINKATKLSTRNAQRAKNSKFCGCFFCTSIFKSSAIEEWISEHPRDKHEFASIVCPHCRMKTVICDEQQLDINKELLIEINTRWFGKTKLLTQNVKI